MGYSIQLGAFSNLGNAMRLTRSLEGQGLDAYYFLWLVKPVLEKCEAIQAGKDFRIRVSGVFRQIHKNTEIKRLFAC
jgi:cell division septation protein DedD